MNIEKALADHALCLNCRSKGVRANLSRAELSRANLFEANLFNYNLCSADLYGADLPNSNLSLANLSYANLSYTNLSESDFSKTNISKAQNIFSVGYRSDGHEFFAVNHGDGIIMVKAGCLWFSWDEAFKHWSKTRGGTTLGEGTLFILHCIKAKTKCFEWN